MGQAKGLSLCSPVLPPACFSKADSSGAEWSRGPRAGKAHSPMGVGSRGSCQDFGQAPEFARAHAPWMGGGQCSPFMILEQKKDNSSQPSCSTFERLEKFPSSFIEP